MLSVNIQRRAENSSGSSDFAKATETWHGHRNRLGSARLIGLIWLKVIINRLIVRALKIYIGKCYLLIKPLIGLKVLP